MSKPTIFFSHSSKDKDTILAIKNKLDAATGGVMDIFMSSDGQSIPFGTNWIHKIEEGLKAAKIMFVFVTENSISSGWIYFEAGYAYSKGIQVIPVGIGVDIGSLKAPLNLLQGFNISSEDSLNNFVTIVNRCFDYHFSSVFENNDYLDVVKKLSSETLDISKFEKIVDKIEFDIFGEQTTENGNKITYDIEKFFEQIIEYLTNNNISYSRENKYLSERTTCIVTNGIKLIYRKKIENPSDRNSAYDNCAKIKFYISSFNFIESFTLLRNILELFEEKKNNYIRIHLKEKYNYIVNAEDGSAIILGHNEFKVADTHIGGYESDELGLRFYIFDCNKYDRNKNPDYVASVVFDIAKVCAENIVCLIDKLNDIGFIFKN